MVRLCMVGGSGDEVGKPAPEWVGLKFPGNQWRCQCDQESFRSWFQVLGSRRSLREMVEENQEEKAEPDAGDTQFSLGPRSA